MNFCTDKVDQGRYQDAIELADQLSERLDEVTQEKIAQLKIRALVGMQGHGDMIPHVVYGTHGRRDKVAYQALPDAIHEALNNMSTMGVLLDVLREAEGEMVCKLRVAIADQIARDNARDLAELEVTE